MMVKIFTHKAWILVFWTIALVFLLTPDSSHVKTPTVWDQVVTVVTGEDDWTVVRDNESLTEQARRIAEEVSPGVTGKVLIKVGNLDTEDCSCGGWFQVMEVDGVSQPVIVIDEVGFANDTDWGYHTVSHEVAHYLNFEENKWEADGHGNRFKHWYQEITPEIYWHYEETYEYGGGEDMFVSEYNY